MTILTTARESTATEAQRRPRDRLTETFELVQRAQAGENEALGRLLDRYEARVRKIVRMRLGSRMRTLVDSSDVLQETFCNAIRGFHNFRIENEASLLNWLCRIAERAIAGLADYHFAKRRDAKRRVALDPDNSTDAGMGLPDARPGPWIQAVVREEESLIEECMLELPDALREIIILRDYVGHCWRDVAAEHGRPSEDAARMMYAKALTKLEKIRSRKRCG